MVAVNGQRLDEAKDAAAEADGDSIVVVLHWSQKNAPANEVDDEQRTRNDRWRDNILFMIAY